MLRRLGFAVSVAVCLVGCGDAVATGGLVHLFTGEITGMGGACYADAIAHKTLLSSDPMDGTAMFDGTQLLPVMWPVGFSARMAGEQVEVLDKAGQVVATTGHFYQLIGRFHAGTFQTCLRGKPEEVVP